MYCNLFLVCIKTWLLLNGRKLSEPDLWLYYTSQYILKQQIRSQSSNLKHGWCKVVSHVRIVRNRTILVWWRWGFDLICILLLRHFNHVLDISVALNDGPRALVYHCTKHIVSWRCACMLTCTSLVWIWCSVHTTHELFKGRSLGIRVSQRPYALWKSALCFEKSDDSPDCTACGSRFVRDDHGLDVHVCRP